MPKQLKTEHDKDHEPCYEFVVKNDEKWDLLKLEKCHLCWYVKSMWKYKKDSLWYTYREIVFDEWIIPSGKDLLATDWS